jgi:type I restriction enzyme S subunit
MEGSHADLSWVPTGAQRLSPGWSWKRLDEVCSVAPGVPRSKIEGSTRFAFVPMRSIDDERGRIVDPETRRGEELPASIKGFARGDVLLARISPSFENGKTAVVEDVAEGFASGDIVVLRPKDGVDPRFIHLVLRSPLVRAHLATKMRGAAGQKRIPAGELAALGVPGADSPRQEAAVQIASSFAASAWGIFEVVARTRTATNALERQMLGSAFPAGAPTTTLGQLCTERPVRYGMVTPGPHVTHGIPYVRVRDYSSGVLAVDELPRADEQVARKAAGAALREGDVLLSIRGTVGRVARVPRELAGGNITQDTVRVSPDDPVLADFLEVYLLSPAAQRWLAEHRTGRAVQGVNVTEVRRLPVPVPEDAELEAVDRVRRARSRLARAQHAVDVAEQKVLRLIAAVETAAVLGLLAKLDGTAPVLVPAGTPRRRQRSDHPEARTPVAAPGRRPTGAARAGSLVELVEEAGGQIGAAELLRISGLDIDVFYEELTAAWKSERVRDRRDDDGESLVEVANAD